MPKRSNLLSVIQAYSTLTHDGFKEFSLYHNIALKAEEINDLSTLVSLLVEKYGQTSADLENFLVGYKIPQIGKEFDLLRFGKNYHINIELKSTSIPEKALKQLERNKYYLKFLGKPVHYFTFDAESSALYYLIDDNTLRKEGLCKLAEILKEQEIEYDQDVKELFNPSDYLVSPFNSTERFTKGEYFLTNQQEESRIKILNSIETTPSASFISLTGRAGTGKTLLAYDIVKYFIEKGDTALILHCGQLNKGHQRLIDSGWNICAIKSLKRTNLNKFKLVLVDEAQRLYINQFDDIQSKISQSNGNCIFAHDTYQTLALHEEKANISGKITDLCKKQTYSLSEKIRSNKEISNFIKALQDNKRNFDATRSNNVQIRYFSKTEDTKNFLLSLNKEEWEVLRFTPSQYSKEFHVEYVHDAQTSHEIIGQEFEGIAVVIDQFFFYDNEGRLSYRGNTYYLATKMLFQNLTRARKRLLVVILKNEQLLKRCLSMT